MKCISVILLCVAALFAQTAPFTNGQAARLVIGQTTFTSQDTNSSDTILGAAGGVAYAANTLFVADANLVGAVPSNHRVLVYPNLSSMLPAPTAQLTYDRKCPVCLGQASVVLGQPDFTSTVEPLNATQNNLRLPTAIASDGVHVVVADTNHNRVLIWNHIPTVNDQPADVVVGQPDFVSFAPGIPASAKTLRGPQGVWIQNGKLYIADTQDNRILIFNHIPTANNTGADLVLGQPNFTSAGTPSVTEEPTSATASSMLNPVSVTTDGTHLFVADLGYSRVLIWNSLPTVNDAPADVEIGQPDMTGLTPNNAFTVATTDNPNNIETPVLCTVSIGVDSNNNPVYPSVCNAVLNYPRFVLAIGNSLAVADGGNDRVLIYNKIPTTNGASADTIIGQQGGTVNQASDASDSLRTPMQLAWDGTNLYVADAYNRRVTVYTLAPVLLPYQAVRNAANLNITANATVTIGGTIAAGNVITININTANATGPGVYTYTVKATDSLDDVVNGLVSSISTSNNGAGDPNIMATANISGNPDPEQVVLTALAPGDLGNNIGLAASVSASATVTATASGASLSGGGDASQIAPGTVVSVVAGPGTALTDQTASASPSQGPLPTTLGGAQVYFNGIPAPLYMVSPTLINAQIPWELNDTTSINAYVRAVRSDGTITTTTPVAVTIVPANPGIYTQPNTTPALGLVYHASSHATGLVSVDGAVNPNDLATVTIRDRNYNYTVQSGDTLDSIRDNLIVLINQDPEVTATAAGVFDRIILTALVSGPAGDNIPIGATTSSGASVIMTAFTQQTCCAQVAGAPVTLNNPAVPNEFIYVIATGLGLPVLNGTNANLVVTGSPYPANGPVTAPQEAVNSIASGSTADVISATIMPGGVGTYIVLLHLNGSIASSPTTSLTIAQDTFVSNIVYFPVVSQ